MERFENWSTRWQPPERCRPEDAVNEVVAALIKREQNGSTGFGKGVAVPHAKHAKVQKMAGTVGRSTAGLDFAALIISLVYSIVLSPQPGESAAAASAGDEHHLQ